LGLSLTIHVPKVVGMEPLRFGVHFVARHESDLGPLDADPDVDPATWSHNQTKAKA